jgi:hypothetical protein
MEVDQCDPVFGLCTALSRSKRPAFMPESLKIRYREERD